MTTHTFLDTEFIDTGHALPLISIGLVAETGPEYYAVSADLDLQDLASHPWLAQHVAPHLPIKPTPRGWKWDTAHLEYHAVKPRATIAADITAYFAKLNDPEIWAYFSPFDTIVFTQLYGPLGDLPEVIPPWTRDLLQEATRAGADLPRQKPPIHHALHDARHDLAIAAAIGLLKPGPEESGSPTSWSRRQRWPGPAQFKRVGPR